MIYGWTLVSEKTDCIKWKISSMATQWSPPHPKQENYCYINMVWNKGFFKKIYLLDQKCPLKKGCAIFLNCDIIINMYSVHELNPREASLCKKNKGLWKPDTEWSTACADWLLLIWCFFTCCMIYLWSTVQITTGIRSCRFIFGSGIFAFHLLWFPALRSIFPLIPTGVESLSASADLPSPQSRLSRSRLK